MAGTADRERPVVPPAKHGFEEVDLGGEVIADRSVSDARPVGDVAEGAVAKPGLGEHLDCGFDDLAPSLF
jgi:hypothetical protein